ncbi:MAG TPA: RDD family protein [Gammaproteobacteria bacterium]
MGKPNNIDCPPAPLVRRLAAMLYDAFLIIALMMAVSIPPVLLNGGPIRDGSMAGEIKNFIFLLYLCGWIFLFYGWFWTHGGQTLGMSAWKIRVVSETGGAITWKQTLIRLLCACLGLANLACVFNRKGLGWHEQLSKTKTILIKPL